jgi:DNA-binding ferritin-like protein (Dps family)
LKPTHWNHIKTGSKSYQNRIKIVSKAYQNRIKIASKPYQNHTKTIKILETSTKNLSLRCFCFFFWSQLAGTISKPYQNHIKIVSKSYQNRIKTISKSYRNHNPKFKAYQIHIVKSYPKPY